MPDQIDGKMISRAQNGDQAAMSAIYDAYRESVFRYFYYRTENRQIAEDLTADVFLRVVKALPRYRLNGAPLKAWVFRITRNLAVDHFRRKKFRFHSEIDENQRVEGHEPSLVAENHMMVQDLAVALRQLTEEQREVVILRFIAGLRIAEVGRLLSRSESAVKGLQRRGLLALRRSLKNWKGYDEGF